MIMMMFMLFMVVRPVMVIVILGKSRDIAAGIDNGELLQLIESGRNMRQGSEAYAPAEIADKSICMDTDISVLLEERRSISLGVSV